MNKHIKDARWTTRFTVAAFVFGVIVGLSADSIKSAFEEEPPCPECPDCEKELEDQQNFYEGVFGAVRDAADRCNGALKEQDNYMKSLLGMLRRCETKE